MQKAEIKLIITSLAPEPLRHHGKTGGDLRLAKIFRRFGQRDDLRISVIATPHNRIFFEKHGIEADFRIVESELKFKSLAGLCFKSIFTILKMFLVLKFDFLKGKNEKTIIYASSDLFWEVIPAYIFKKRHKSVEWVQAIYHIYPDWKERPGKKTVNFFGYYLQKFSFWLINKRADKIVLINNIVKNNLEQMGFSKNKLFVSSCGIDTDYLENLEKYASAYDGVFLARISHSKGISNLVEIWKNVSSIIPEAKLAVIGGGGETEKKYLREKVKEYGLEKNIDLLGFLENDKAYSILKSGKVFLLPSHEEGWGIAIAEAMACGLPVVSWDLPVYEEIFENKTHQINENNIESFAQKVVELLKDDATREKMAAAGKEFVKKYSWDKVAEREFEIISG